jgi:enamine deaminase RidA (YjgF/YER057c/UK114 family)
MTRTIDDHARWRSAPSRESTAVHPQAATHRIETRRGAAVVRRSGGPTADQVFVLCRPGDGIVGGARQAETLYEALLEALASEGIGPEAIVREAVFFRRIREDLEAARSARSRVLRGAGVRACPPATTFVGQPPLAPDARLELSAAAVVPCPGTPASVRDVTRTAACACEACAPGVRARVVGVGHQTFLYAGDVHGAGRSPFEEAYDMFRVADGLLRDAAMSFRDVVRTWIHVRDIGRDYEALNGARREFFRHCGLERRPASTGVQGAPFPGAHAFSMSLHAVQSTGRLDVSVMSTPFLNEACSYGADFSRGLKVAQADGVTLHVSGTASVDEAGRTVRAGDFPAQVDRMLDNVASLLAGQGATFADVVSGVTYLRNPDDAPVLRAMCQRRGFDGFPCAQVEARLCRPELLCETEALAILPRATAGG